MKAYFLTAAAVFSLPHHPAPSYGLHLNAGEKIGNIFSRTISFSGEGFTASVSRISGTCEYSVKEISPDKPAFDTHWVYDGATEGKSTVFYDQGGARVSYNTPDSLNNNTDGSGVLYNPLIWGSLPNVITKGTKWEVDIPVAWELGGPGKEQVKVLAADPEHHLLSLQREGTSDGTFDHDRLDITIAASGKNVKVHVTPGPAHWIGWSTFQDGLVWSDELMVTRTVTLTGDGMTWKGEEREYILLNRMP